MTILVLSLLGPLDVRLVRLPRSRRIEPCRPCHPLSFRLPSLHHISAREITIANSFDHIRNLCTSHIRADTQNHTWATSHTLLTADLLHYPKVMLDSCMAAMDTCLRLCPERCIRRTRNMNAIRVSSANLVRRNQGYLT